MPCISVALPEQLRNWVLRVAANNEMSPGEVLVIAMMDCHDMPLAFEALVRKTKNANANKSS